MAVTIPPRERNGRLQRPRGRGAEHVDPTSPTAARRLRDAALRGVMAAEYGTELGRLYLAGQLDSPQYLAGKRWDSTVARYHEATGANVALIASNYLEGVGAESDPDPDTEEGRRRLKLARVAVKEMLGAVRALEAAGRDALTAVRAICEDDRSDLTWEGVKALKLGLSALDRHWRLTKNGRS